jgi:hypothetical protein
MLERVHYFSRQLITADDMITEQEYFRAKLRRHNLKMHGWGIVRGCTVTQNSDKSLNVDRGYVITPQGDDILIENPLVLNITAENDWVSDPCFQATSCPAADLWQQGSTSEAYLAIRYQECPTRPVRVHPLDCGCVENTCDYSRIREGSELALLNKITDDPDNPWVVLATINLAKKGISSVQNNKRRKLIGG